MHQPPPDIHTALYRAALSSGVPISLLTGLCFALSKYDARAVGTLPKSDAQHAEGRGLFLLSQAACDVLGVADPFDPVENACAAGVLLARLARDYKHDPQAMVVGYVYGRVATRAAVAAQRAMPAAVRELLDAAMSAQVWLQERAEPDTRSTRAWPPDGSQAAALDNAIEGLLAANPSFAPAIVTADRWRRWRDAQHASLVFDGTSLVKFWELYDAAYARAPITDSRTPLPSRIKPEAYTPAVDAAKDAAKRAVQSAMPALEQAWAGVAIVLLLWGVAASSRRS